MLKKWMISLLIVLFVLALGTGGTVQAKPQDPANILLKKYPNERVKVIKTTDINGDKKNESFILTRSGNFYMINAQGVLTLVNTGIQSDEEADEPTLQFIPVSKTEKHVMITYYYFPSNTQVFIYRMKNGTLQKSLAVMGDQGVEVDKQGRIHQFWKKYRNEGGWDLQEGIYTWNAKAGKYKASGSYSLTSN